MTKYLISFPGEAMVLTEDEFPVVAAAARSVIEEAKAAGVYVFAGGINGDVELVLVSANGNVSRETCAGSHLDGGYAILELPGRDEAIRWATRIAAACRCSQELREFMDDAAS